MGWAAMYIAKLRAGETVSFRPRGGSMPGRIEFGQLCTVEPITDTAGLEVWPGLLDEVQVLVAIDLAQNDIPAFKLATTEDSSTAGWARRRDLRPLHRGGYMKSMASADKGTRLLDP
jgi:hypothetical protein